MEQGRQVGDWKCQKLLGRGSFGSVGLWRNSKAGQCIAIKRFEIRAAVQPNDKLCIEMQKRWQKEVDIMYNAIKCEFVVSTIPLPPDFVDIDIGSDLTADPSHPSPPLPLLCMEYCSGGDLRRLLKRPENISGLREKDIRTILDHVSKAVTYLHEKSIIHRDLKPENILIYYDSRNCIKYKLSDLGFAKDLSNSSNLCSTVVGTLQYLAPEIYLGKMYDKSVDYWSFALIAFEIMTGMRPFLHGESPSQWLPLVEQKPKEAICIYRKDDREIEFSKTIPYYTHCTDLFKQCLETWLRTMLQLDSSRRGKKLSAPDETDSRSPSPSVPIVGLQMLSNILNTKTLHIRTISKRLGFAIGKSTKMADIQQFIARDTGLSVENQLILTNDGIDIKKEDLAAKFVELTDLFLIPRSPELVRQRLKMPKSVNTFLTSWQSIKDPLKLRVIWTCAVYFVQSELEKVETLKKASIALKTWIQSKYAVELRNLQSSIDKAGACLEKILELEVRLEGLDREAKKHLEDPPGAGIIYWRSEMEALRTFYRGCLDDWCENVVLRPVLESKLEEIYYTILKNYEDGRSSDGSISGAHSEALVTSVCQFVVQRDQIAESITYNVTTQLAKIRNDDKLVENLQSVVQKLNLLTEEVMDSRFKTHSRLLGLATPDQGQQSTIANGPSAVSSSPKRELSAVGSANPNSVSGGGHPAEISYSQGMSKSASVSSSPPVKPSSSCGKGVVAMTRSLNSPIKGSCTSPPISKLMETSMIIKSETEDTLQALSSTLGRMNSILQESSELDWEFLDS